MEYIKHHQVNWIDGMKINKQHFIALENSLYDYLMDATAIGLNNDNYGLLPPLPEKSSSLKVNLNTDNQNLLQVKILECRAITSGGAVIEILENSQEILGYSLQLPSAAQDINSVSEAVYYLMLSVQPYSRVPIGNADPSEEPPRQPFVQPEIKLHIIPEDQLLQKEVGPFFISIGKVKSTEGQPELLSEYIPPCVSIQSHPKLKELYLKYDKFFGQMEIDTVKIQRKITEKQQDNELANSVSLLATNLLFFLSMGISEYRWKIKNQSPVAMFELLSRCARVMKNTIDANSSSSREELLNYFTDWCNLNQGEFEEVLLKAVNLKYEHVRIMNSTSVIDQFVDVTSALFNKLCDLEYIGKKKDTGIFVKEQSPSSGSSFLAD